MFHHVSTIFACLPFRSGISSSRASALGNNFAAGSVHKNLSAPTPGTQTHQQRILAWLVHLYTYISKIFKSNQNITKYVISRLLDSLSRGREKCSCSRGNLDSVLDNVLDTPPLYCSLGLEIIGNRKPHHVSWRYWKVSKHLLAHHLRTIYNLYIYIYIPHRF